MYKCPVCLTESLNTPYVHCSYEICPMCGVEYGYDDAISADEHKREDFENVIAEIHTNLREFWISKGKPNWQDEINSPGFDYGVSWLKEYYSDEKRKELWERRLCLQFVR